jgi:hypothetical protein
MFNLAIKINSFIAALLVGVAYADAGNLPPVPQQVFAGCINGRANIWVSKTGSLTNHWFQMRLVHEGEDAWQTVQFQRSGIAKGDNDGLAYSAPVDFWGSAIFRVAETNSAGEHAGWLTVGPLTNHVRHAGYCIGTTGNAFKTNINDGVVTSLFESNATWAGVPNPWIGIAFHSDKVVGKIRYVPRQSSLGQARIAGDIFEMADDENFTNPVRIGDVVPDAPPLGGVVEMKLANPVTGRYFRVYHRLQKDSYLSISELEFVPASFVDEISFSITPDDFTNMWPSATWSIPRSGQCVSGVVERAVSPEGPFVEVSDWSEDLDGSVCVDKTIPIGVTYYYRVKAACVGGGIEGMVYSKVLPYVRSRRLERDPENLTVLKNAVSVLYPYKYMSIVYGESLTKAKLAFDGDSSTYTEYSFTKDGIKYCNAALGVDLGSKYHIAYVYVYPRESTHSTIHDRTRKMAVHGANKADLSDRVQISDLLGGFDGGNVWQYNATTNTSDVFRYVFLFSPNNFGTYGNAGEVGFYGFTDQDIIDSGVLVPPNNVVAVPEDTAVVLSWSNAWNHSSYAIDRRKFGQENWTRIASDLATDSFTYCDDDNSVRKGVYEYRVLAVLGEDEVSSARVRCNYSPKRGLIVTVK